MNNKVTKSSPKERALELLADPLFLHRAGLAIGALGVVGEERNRLTIFLAGITKELDDPVSVLFKGESGSGKSNTVTHTLQLFPTESVLELSSLSAKALVHSDESLSKRILFIQEYRGGKDAQLLIRLQQSEGRVAHEYTTMIGRQHGTRVAEKSGKPVVITTTTDDKVYQDDETRFLSLHADSSAAQSLAIVKAAVHRIRSKIAPALSVWRTALSLVKQRDGDFLHPPVWLEYVAAHLPLEKVRVRRDWNRFLSLCSACALLRLREERRPVNITFADYAVAYRILEPAFAATTHGIHHNELAVVRAVEKLRGRSKAGVTAREIGDFLGWKEGIVYKYVRIAAKGGRLAFSTGTHERNQKFILLIPDRNAGFLPRPVVVFRNNEELGPVARYADPLTGKTLIFRRE